MSKTKNSNAHKGYDGGITLLRQSKSLSAGLIRRPSSVLPFSSSADVTHLPFGCDSAICLDSLLYKCTTYNATATCCSFKFPGSKPTYSKWICAIFATNTSLDCSLNTRGTSAEIDSRKDLFACPAAVMKSKYWPESRHVQNQAERLSFGITAIDRNYLRIWPSFSDRIQTIIKSVQRNSRYEGEFCQRQ